VAHRPPHPADPPSLPSTLAGHDLVAHPLRVNGLDLPAVGFGDGSLRSPYKPFEVGPFKWGKAYSLAHERGVDLLVEPFNQDAARDPETGKVVPQQSCGTTSLAMLFNYFRPGTIGQAEIDAEIRRSNHMSFTNPADIVAFAQDHGYQATMRNHATLDNLTASIDQGLPVEVIMNPLTNSNEPKLLDPDDIGTHYVVVNGYNRDPATGKVSQVIVSDPWGLHYTLDVDEFKRRWAKPHLVGLQTGLDNFMIQVVPRQGAVRLPDGSLKNAEAIALPPAPETLEALTWAMMVAGLAMDIRNATAQGMGIASAGAGAAGLVKAISLMAAAPFALAGRTGVAGAILQAGQKVSDACRSGLEWVANAGGGVAQAIASATSAVSSAVSAAAQVASQAVGSVVQAIGGLFKWW
jgi:predicted double-glycine peptidase